MLRIGETERPWYILYIYIYTHWGATGTIVNQY